MTSREKGRIGGVALTRSIGGVHVEEKGSFLNFLGLMFVLMGAAMMLALELRGSSAVAPYLALVAFIGVGVGMVLWDLNAKRRQERLRRQRRPW